VENSLEPSKMSSSKNKATSPLISKLEEKLRLHLQLDLDIVSNHGLSLLLWGACLALGGGKATCDLWTNLEQLIKILKMLGTDIHSSNCSYVCEFLLLLEWKNTLQGEALLLHDGRHYWTSTTQLNWLLQFASSTKGTSTYCT
jgi:hypothetical protein